MLHIKNNKCNMATYCTGYICCIFLHELNQKMRNLGKIYVITFSILSYILH